MAAEAAAMQAAEAAEAAGTAATPQPAAPAEATTEDTPPVGTTDTTATPAAAGSTDAAGAATEDTATADADRDSATEGAGGEGPDGTGGTGTQDGPGPEAGEHGSEAADPAGTEGTAVAGPGDAGQAPDTAGAAAEHTGAEAAEAEADPRAEDTAAGPSGQERRAPHASGAGAGEHGREAFGADASSVGRAGRADAGGRGSGAQGGAAAASRKVEVDAGAVAATRVVLEEGGAPGELGEAAVRALGERAGEALRADPWLVLGLPGVRMEPADAFARALLGAECRPDDERRANALVGWLLERAADQGHTALRAADLESALAARAVPDPAAALASAAADGRVLVFPENPGKPGAEAPAEEDEEESEPDVPLLVGLDRYALAEESLADGCVRLLRSFESEGDGADWEQAAAGAPSRSAADLIRAAAGSGLVVHSGGEAAREEPVALVAAARAAGLRAYAAAYTANGRRRLADALGEDAAVTVEALLAGTQGPGRAPDGALALDVLAVLDAQQLGTEEAATLVEAVPDGARLVLSGDEHAMWSAGPGHAFADLLAAKICPRAASRTPDPGPIGELTSLVGIGELAPVDAPDKEVVVVPVRDPREAVHRTVQLVADSVPRALGVPADRTQVITPGHGGAVGTRVLNAALKERLNPGPGRFAGFDPGDRVVHVPVPGRTLPGTVVGAEPDGLRLECEDGPVLVPRADVAATVRHGWAITGHQAAGMRWPAVVVVVPGDAGPLLTRSWVYTAFARGERHLSVVQGADQGLAQAVAGPPAAPRTTRLVTVLRELATD
nr:helix-hairpin-helix domain-containing protein [Actinacidiphila alni]